VPALAPLAEVPALAALAQVPGSLTLARCRRSLRSRRCEVNTSNRSQFIRVAVVSAVFVVIGIALGDAIPWYVTGFFVVCAIVGVLAFIGVLPRERPPAEQLTIDEEGITRTARNLREHVAWADVVRICIMTNDQGPYLEDVYFVIEGRNGEGCVVSHELATRGRLLYALHERLDGVNNKEVIEAMLSTSNHVFTIWEAKG
jgi:hypothetical protein